MKTVKITYNRKDTFYEDKHVLGTEFKVFNDSKFPGMWLLFPSVGYILIQGLFILDTDCEVVK